MSVHHVRRCLLCGAAAIDAKSRGRVVKTTCLTCRAALIIEFDPPDDPTIRARIERVDSTDSHASESYPDKRSARR